MFTNERNHLEKINETTRCASVAVGSSDNVRCTNWISVWELAGDLALFICQTFKIEDHYICKGIVGDFKVRISLLWYIFFCLHIIFSLHIMLLEKWPGWNPRCPIGAKLLSFPQIDPGVQYWLQSLWARAATARVGKGWMIHCFVHRLATTTVSPVQISFLPLYNCAFRFACMTSHVYVHI